MRVCRDEMFEGCKAIVIDEGQFLPGTKQHINITFHLLLDFGAGVAGLRTIVQIYVSFARSMRMPGDWLWWLRSIRRSNARRFSMSSFSCLWPRRSSKKRVSPVLRIFPDSSLRNVTHVHFRACSSVLVSSHLCHLRMRSRLFETVFTHRPLSLPNVTQMQIDDFPLRTHHSWHPYIGLRWLCM